MNNIRLYAHPGTCSKVSMILLEEAGIEYAIYPVNLMRGEHKQADYLAINPKAKVPALKIDDVVLTENPVLIQAIVQRYPDAKLMPVPADNIEELQQWSDLCFCASNLHPALTRVCKPEFFASGDTISEVKEKGTEAMQAGLSLVEERLVDQRWWYGDVWSAMDAYIYWVYTRIARCDFDFTNFPCYSAHARRMEERPAVKRTIVKESEILAGYAEKV